MKHKTALLTLTAAIALGLSSCSQNEPATPAADNAKKAASSATEEADKAAEAARVEAAKTAEAAKVDAAKAAEAAKVDAAKTAEAAKVEAARIETAKAEAAKAEAAKVEAAKAADAAKAEAAKAADTAKTQGLIDKATGLVADNKFSDATGILEQLAGHSLTSDQQKLVDGLKEAIQKAMAAKAVESAAGNVGGLINK